MRHRTVGLVLSAAIASAFWLASDAAGTRADTSGQALQYWPEWRGPLMNGVAPKATPPVEWSETKNVRWKVPIPGKGSSTPVIWGDRIYLLTAVPTEKRGAAPAPPPEPPPPPPAPPTTPPVAASPDSAAAPRDAAAAPSGGAQAGGPPTGGRPRLTVQPEFEQRFVVMALRRSDGKVLWERTVREELPHEGTHPTGTWASASAVTDGERVFAFFGSRGLYAFDKDGTKLWEKDLGDMTIKLGFGEGSSPALAGDRLFLQWDHEGESFMVALDKKTGRELWRQKREEGTSWATPLVVEHAGRTQVVTSATNKKRRA
jgi:hypothetical protein